MSTPRECKLAKGWIFSYDIKCIRKMRCSKKKNNNNVLVDAAKEIWCPL